MLSYNSIKSWKFKIYKPFYGTDPSFKKIVGIVILV